MIRFVRAVAWSCFFLCAIATNVSAAPFQNNDVWTQAQCLRASSSHPDVLILGDSIFDGWSGYLLHVFPNAVVDAKVSRQFSAAVPVYQHLLQYPRIRAISTIVVELGTNGPIHRAGIQQFMSLANGRQVYWIVPSVPRPWQQEVVHRLEWAASVYPNLQLVNWYGYVQSSPKPIAMRWFRPGMVHPDWAGIQQEVGLLLNTISQENAQAENYGGAKN